MDRDRDGFLVMGWPTKMVKKIKEKKMVDLTTRWCPTHRRYEINPLGRLLCSAAWRDQYALEDDVKAEKIGTPNALLQIAAQLERFTNALLDVLPGEPVSAPPRPTPPRPAPIRPATGTIDL